MQPTVGVFLGWGQSISIQIAEKHAISLVNLQTRNTTLILDIPQNCNLQMHEVTMRETSWTSSMPHIYIFWWNEQPTNRSRCNSH